MASYKLSQQAKQDLQRIYRYGVLNFGEDLADRYLDAFFARFAQIAEQPELYPSVDAIRAGYRRSVCGVDSIYYRMVDGTVEIISILGRQNRDDLL